MRQQVLAIISGLVGALIVAIVFKSGEAITGIIGVLGTVLYKALRVDAKVEGGKNPPG